VSELLPPNAGCKFDELGTLAISALLRTTTTLQFISIWGSLECSRSLFQAHQTFVVLLATWQEALEMPLNLLYLAYLPH